MPPQVRAPFNIPSVAAVRGTVPFDIAQDFGLDQGLAKGELITAQAVEGAIGSVLAIEKTNIAQYPDFTDDVLQTAKDRAFMLRKLHAEAAFRDPEAMQNIFNRLTRVEARLDNGTIVKKNRRQLAINPLTTVFIARKKQEPGDGGWHAKNLAPVNNMPMPPLQDHAVVGAVFSGTIDTHAQTHAMILNLMRFYNETFGIIPSDPITVRWQKLRDWLTEPLL
ncbi:hypothetical protein B0H11DRAFT_2026199 [Mycena galericulata]|nr:hypothetical protein B0H11DRAFT_2026199 [Mycena galericulata]